MIKTEFFPYMVAFVSHKDNKCIYLSKDQHWEGDRHARTNFELNVWDRRLLTQNSDTEVVVQCSPVKNRYAGLRLARMWAKRFTQITPDSEFSVLIMEGDTAVQTGTYGHKKELSLDPAMDAMLNEKQIAYKRKFSVKIQTEYDVDGTPIYTTSIIIPGWSQHAETIAKEFKTLWENRTSNTVSTFKKIKNIQRIYGLQEHRYTRMKTQAPIVTLPKRKI